MQADHRTLAFTPARDRPLPAHPASSSGESIPTYFWLAFAAVILNLLVSSNLLYVCGIDYAVPGGNPLTKFHPGTYLAFMAFAMMLWRHRTPIADFKACVSKNPASMFFLSMIGICFLFGVLSNGISGTAVYIENYAPAALIVVMSDEASDRMLKNLAYVMLGLFLFNVVLSVIETLLHWHLIPIYVGQTLMVMVRDDFRGSALYDHPLTGAAMTMIAIFLLLSMPQKSMGKWLMLMILFIGLISFGGRAALGVTALMLAGWGGVVFVGRCFSGRLQLRDVGLAFLALTVVPAITAVILTQTSIGERLMAHLFWDQSASTRVVQWQVLGSMTPKELLFGTTFDRVKDIVFQVGMQFPFTDIENPWLLMMVNLGIVGVAFFAAGFGVFVIHLWRRAPLAGRMLMVALMIVISTSNSLGRKSNLLTVAVPAILATAAFSRKREVESAPEWAPEGQDGRRTSDWRVFPEQRLRRSGPINT